MFGIDFGGVISGGPALVPKKGGENQKEKREDTKGFFGSNYLEVGEMERAMESIRKIVSFLGPSNVFVISKAGEKISSRFCFLDFILFLFCFPFVIYQKIEQKNGWNFIPSLKKQI